MKKAVKILIPCAALVIAIGAGAYYFRLGRRGSPSSVSAASIVRPEMRKLESTVSATGSIRLRIGTEVRVGSELSGIVKQLNVTVGSHINKGETIAEIDSRPLEARIEQARAQVDMDEIAFRKAGRDLERTRGLTEAGLIPRKQLDDDQAAFETARAKVEKSKHDLAVVEVDLNYIRITAPISGTVASVSTQEGETVAAAFTSPTFVTIIEDNALELVAMVDETDIGSVKLHDPVRFTVQTYPSQEFAGVVRRIAPKATIVSGVVNYEVGISIDKAASMLKPDMTADVTIKTAEHQTLVVPDQAIQRDGDNRFVYVEGAGGLEKRAVAVGIREAGFTEIKRGLSQNDLVYSGDPGTSQRRN